MSRVVHFEIQADDVERAKSFYASVFDWSFRALLLLARPASLRPHHLHRAGDRNVTDLPQAAGMDPLGHRAAVRAARRDHRLHDDTAAALGDVVGIDDAVVGQVEDRARDITPRAFNASTTRPRNHHHEPRRAD